MRPLKIWLMPSAFAPHTGGVEELTAQLGRELTERGHQITVITNRWPTDLPSVEVAEGLPVERVRFTLPARHPRTRLEHMLGRPRARRRLSRLPLPDVVHVQCASSQLAFASHFCRQTGVPLVLTTQGETAMDAGSVYQRNRWLRQDLRTAAAEAAVLTACSEWTRNHAATIASAFHRSVVVPNAVRLEDWPRSQPTNDPIVAAWGRHVPQKGFDLLIRAFDLVREQVPDAQLRIAGSGPSTDELKAVAGAGVQFEGSLDRTGVGRLLAVSRVAAVPSRIEPFGIVALEALASGRGLVYSSRGGLGEAAGGLGRSADPFDPVDFATALVNELMDPTPAASGRARANELSWANVTDQYETLYAQALSGRDSGRD